MVEAKIDELIEEVEVLNTEITKINFDIDGFKEESDRLIEKQPFMVRHIQQNEKKMFKLLKNLEKRMAYKHELDSKLDVIRMEKKAKEAKTVDKKAKTIKKTKPKQ
jgi:hypothetical protein